MHIVSTDLGVDIVIDYGFFAFNGGSLLYVDISYVRSFKFYMKENVVSAVIDFMHLTFCDVLMI